MRVFGQGAAQVSIRAAAPVSGARDTVTGSIKWGWPAGRVHRRRIGCLGQAPAGLNRGPTGGRGTVGMDQT